MHLIGATMGTGRPLSIEQRGEWRRYPRFRPARSVSVAVETAAGTRFVGQIRDISASGVCLEIAWRIGHSSVQSGLAGQAEFVLDDTSGNVFKVSGRLARMGHELAAFAFDRVLSSDVIRQIAREAGAIEWDGLSAVVHGSLHPGLADDVLRAVENGKLLDLRHVSTIDSGGIGLAMLAIERGNGLIKCHAAIQPMLQIGGVCARCQARDCLSSVCSQSNANRV